MNARQTAFYRQARSDWVAFRHLHPGGPPWWTRARQAWCLVVGVRPFSLPVCHELHYLQMCTEKLAKAYYKTDLGKGHKAFRRFMTDLPSNPGAIAPLGFGDLAALTRWQLSAARIADALEDLAPAVADGKNLPNPEYPWPKIAPATAPVDYPFTAEVFNLLEAQAGSGEPPFLTILGRMIETMQSAGWHL